MKHLRLFTVLMLLSSLSFSQSLDMDYLKEMKTRNIGPGGMSGRVTTIDVRPDDDATFYIGTASGGIWKTESGGTIFSPVFDKQDVANIGAIAIDPSKPDVVWAGTGEGNPRNSLNGGFGLYRSLDGGRNWKLMGLEETRHIHRIIIHPENSDHIYVGAIGSPWGPHQERGVYKSTDGGESWEKILYVNELTGVADMVMDPTNPDKLFVAMWEHQRWPWFFRSGGEGSGLYMTVDGGRNWKEIGSKEGLPEGELGRMGLAIAAGNTDYVYALVESKKNAIYRSTDGGYTWEKRGEKNIGTRPFYYADIFVDPSNENRLYSLYSVVNVSEDGGKNFSTLIGYNIHLDHHAWWIHPENPSFMIDGNDGGMAITYDRGKSWRHVSNLPVSQFYHIGVDMEIPYNVYGGMQDNGSWCGPAYLWREGGIVNTDWDFLMGGDGFDVVPVPDDPSACYAMSQQGNVGRLDLETGAYVNIKPAPAPGQDLRFHWNAAIAQDPFDASTIYFGSQFVHRSIDRGDNWELISPDLTSNDSTKQIYGESGGLTYDVTGAENHTCILAIAPSPVKKDVIWIGTDDGKIQMTTDGGRSWNLLSSNIKELPDGAWIPQIVPSASNAAEAFVVVNNYRQNDYAPYLFHTRDYGKKWTRVVNEGDVPSYVLSFARDPEEEKLQFLGTETGLYVSIDAGENWSKWTNGFPTVSTMDMVIHPRELDLVIGTFGRSAWILDDIRPLRALAGSYDEIQDAGIFAVDPPTAYMANRKNSPGYYFTGDAYFEGENRSPGARISYFINKEEDDKKDSVHIEVLNGDGQVIRSMKHIPEHGLNRSTWYLDRKGKRLDFSEKGRSSRGEGGGGGYVLPGSYDIRISFKGDTSSCRLEVKPDPRIPFDLAGRKKSLEKADAWLEKVEVLNAAVEEIRECRRTYELIKKLKGEEASESLADASDSMKVKLDALSARIFRDESVQGIYTNPDLWSSELRGGNTVLYTNTALTGNQLQKFEASMKVADEALAEIHLFMETEWKAYRKVVEAENISLFKSFN